MKMDINMKDIDFPVIFPTFKNFEGIITRKNPANSRMPIVGAYHQSDEAPQREGAQINFLRVLEKASEKPEILRYLLIQLDEKIIREPTNDNKTFSYIVRMSSGLSHLGIAGVASREISAQISGAFPFFFQTRHEDPATIVNNVKYFDDGRPYFSSYAKIIGAGFTKLSNQITFYGKSRAFAVDYGAQIEYQLGMTCHEFCQKIFEEALPDYKINVINNEVEATGVDLPDLN